MGNAKIQKRKIYIDFLKIIAIYMVLFNHTHANGFLLFLYERNSKLYPLYLFNAIFIKIAVPLFFMSSGALLLGKEETYKNLLLKKFFKYLVVLIVASIIVYMYDCLRINPQMMFMNQFLKKVYTSNITPAYWYLYRYLAYILMIPFLRKMAVYMSDKDYKWMLLMFGLIKSIFIIEFLIGKGTIEHSSNFSFFISSDYIFYPLMGYYIDQRMEMEEFTKKKAVLLIVLSVTAIVICSFMTHYKCSLNDEWTGNTCQTFFGTLIFIPTITAFYLAKMWFINHNLSETSCHIITTIGGTTFGIYLIEEICRDETKFIFRWLKLYIPKLLACWIWVLAACILGCVITLLLKRIPGVKNFI